MPGCRVHGAGARIERHVLAEDHRHLALVERVLETQALQRLAIPLGEDPVRTRADAFRKRFEQGLGDDQARDAALAIELREHVVVERIQADRLVRGQRPGSRGPDHDRRDCQLVAGEAEAPRGVERIHDVEADVHGRRRALLVLDFRFGKR